jgi:hypothetical protein
MRIEQTLHGYSEGHRLLAGSIELPRQAKFSMSSLSDMSGRSMVVGFEEYLTGYSLSDIGLYALARTWYAPEMERPGCVWTHTLLIDKKDLGSARDLGGLRRLFRRPSEREGRPTWDEYLKPLEYVEYSPDPTIAPPWLDQTASLAVWALYGIPDLPVFHPAEHARPFEDLLMALWAQQWPSLRYAFRFCTGAIGVRSSGGKPFDYLVVPLSSVREVRREVPASTVLASGGWPTPPELSDWVMLASNDLTGRSSQAFRRFLREQTSGKFNGRTAFAPLAELFPIREKVSARMTVSALIHLVGQHYPEPGTADRLKRAIVGKDFPLATSLIPATTECDVLRALATTDGDAAFDPERLEIDERARTFWERDSKGAESLISSLVGNDLNSIGERILLSLIRGMSIVDAIRYSDAIPGLVATVVGMNPDIARSPGVWRGQPDHQRQLFDAATGSKAPPVELQRSIVLAMLHAGSDAAAERAARRFGPVVVDTVLSWFDESEWQSPLDLPEGWRRAIASHTAAILEWLGGRQQVREATGALIADLLNPHATEVQRHGTDPWLKVLETPSAGTPTAARNRLCAFLLALGFDTPRGRPDELVARTFAPVHTALAGNAIGYESWIWLDDHLPSLALWRNWDRCERLRRGLAERFVSKEWPIRQFFRCASDKDLLQALLKSCGKVDGGNRLLKKIRRSVSDGEVELDRQWRQVVEWYT